jgi:riboflavin synthase
MFTGLVEQTGQIVAVSDDAGDVRLRIMPETMWPDLKLGESIAISGVCLTVVHYDDSSFEVTLSQETVAKTAAHWRGGGLVNLERAIRLGSRLGGHLVSGHVDGVGIIVAIDKQPGAYTVKLRVPEHLKDFLVPKGSIAVDGVSLTIVDVGGPAGSRSDFADHELSLWLIPHTLEVTSLRQWQIGTLVNVEADQIAKYLARLIAMREAKGVSESDALDTPHATL